MPLNEGRWVATHAICRSDKNGAAVELPSNGKQGGTSSVQKLWKEGHSTFVNTLHKDECR